MYGYWEGVLLVRLPLLNWKACVEWTQCIIHLHLYEAEGIHGPPLPDTEARFFKVQIITNPKKLCLQVFALKICYHRFSFFFFFFFQPVLMQTSMQQDRWGTQKLYSRPLHLFLSTIFPHMSSFFSLTSFLKHFLALFTSSFFFFPSILHLISFYSFIFFIVDLISFHFFLHNPFILIHFHLFSWNLVSLVRNLHSGNALMTIKSVSWVEVSLKLTY